MPAHAQGFNWPWSEPEKRPVPRDPVYRPPAQGAPPPVVQPGPGAQWSERSPLCIQLEQRLVQEGQNGNQARDMLPKIEAERREVDRVYQQGQAQLERADCFDYFLFSKTLRRTRRCVDMATEVENAKRRLAELEAQRQQLGSSAGRSYQDEIIRELARNNCGPAYQQEARKRDGNPFSSIWQDEESSGPGSFGNYSNLPFATYRTLCVRLCDGYYFPISFSTLPNHFERDETACTSKCAAPVELYYHQNPGGAVEQMVGVRNQEPYTNLKSAFVYRKQFIQGCSCKQSEYVPQTPMPPDRRADAKAAPPPAPPR